MDVVWIYIFFDNFSYTGVGINEFSLHDVGIISRPKGAAASFMSVE